jgi:hypothetical protein
LIHAPKAQHLVINECGEKQYFLLPNYLLMEEQRLPQADNLLGGLLEGQ